jgi:hypothetical protein
MGTSTTPTTVIRMLPTNVCGNVATTSLPNSFTLNVLKIGRFPVSAFTGVAANPWSVTFVSVPFVRPVTFTASTNDPVLATGSLVSTGGNNMQALFAVNLTNHGFAAAEYATAKANAITAGGGTSSVTFDVQSSTSNVVTKVLVTGCVDPSFPVATSLVVTSASSGQGLFVVRTAAGSIRGYATFAEWSADLSNNLAAGSTLKRVAATGNPASASLTITVTDCVAATALLEP